jgi:hypothetical protein
MKKWMSHLNLEKVSILKSFFKISLGYRIFAMQRKLNVPMSSHQNMGQNHVKVAN